LHSTSKVGKKAKKWRKLRLVLHLWNVIPNSNLSFSDRLSMGENEHQDFKEAITSERKIAKTIASLANTKGGTIWVGVRDNLTFRSIDPLGEQHRLEQAAEHFCDPPLELTFKVHRIGTFRILEANVPEAIHKPIYSLRDDDQWMVYIRVKDESLLATKTMVEVLLRQSSDQPITIELGSKEQFLLDYLKEHPHITLKQYSDLMNLGLRRARRIVVNLLAAGLIRVKYKDKEEYYCR
jgi:predicted HTH transcriptional regulator